MGPRSSSIPNYVLSSRLISVVVLDPQTNDVMAEKNFKREYERREKERRLEREAEARRAAILEEQQKLAQAARQNAEEEARKRAETEAAVAKERALQQYIARMKLKIRGRVVVPPGMSGNP